MKIGKDNLDKIRSANIGNIVKKVKAGKVLTAYEQKQLDAAKEDPLKDQSQGSQKKVAQSMKQAFAFWGIPVLVMKQAKAAGCLAFVEHRIHRDELLKWIEANPEAGKTGGESSTIEELKRQKLLEEVALLKIKVAKENGSSIEKEQARQEWARALAICQEEARGLINDDDKYRIFCERIKAKLGNE
jgi:hypothetical protein